MAAFMIRFVRLNNRKLHVRHKKIYSVSIQDTDVYRKSKSYMFYRFPSNAFLRLLFKVFLRLIIKAFFDYNILAFFYRKSVLHLLK